MMMKRWKGDRDELEETLLREREKEKQEWDASDVEADSSVVSASLVSVFEESEVQGKRESTVSVTKDGIVDVGFEEAVDQEGMEMASCIKCGGRRVVHSSVNFYDNVNVGSRLVNI